MLKLLLMLTSMGNCLAGLIVALTWGAMWPHVPIIVPFIGASLIIQGAYTILYLHGDFDRWRDLATGALFAGEGLSACVGAGGLIQGIIHNVNTPDMEMAPVLAGLLMLSQAVLALLYLLLSDKLRPRVNGHSSA
jgi:hypothetical protein